MATSAARKWGHGVLKKCLIDKSAEAQWNVAPSNRHNYWSIFILPIFGEKNKNLPFIGVIQPNPNPASVCICVYIYLYAYVCILNTRNRNQAWPLHIVPIWRISIPKLFVVGRLSSISQLVSPRFWSSKPVLSDQPVNTSMKSFTSVLEQVPVIWFF